MIRSQVCLVLAILFAMIGAISAPRSEAAPLFNLPPIDRAVPGARIGWAVDERAAVIAARDDGKPLVMLSMAANCGWCKDLARDTLRCPSFNALAGKAHFLIVDQTDDPLTRSLDIKLWPSISVLKVSNQGITELRRIIGMVDEPTLMGYLAPFGLRPGAPNPLGQAPTGLPAEHSDKCDNRRDRHGF